MGIIYQHDKRTGNTYAYESHAWWDKEKKMSRAKRTLIGRVDKDGSIVATDGRGRKDKVKVTKAKKPNYKKLYETLLKRCASQDELIAALNKELKKD